MFAQRLKELRAANGISQDKLAEVLEKKGQPVTRGQISMWESKHNREPSYEILNAIAAYFKVTPGYLTGHPAARDEVELDLQVYKEAYEKLLVSRDLPDPPNNIDLKLSKLGARIAELEEMLLNMK